jgi:hypothetical protein
VICSTHSPAFYSQGQKANAVCYFVRKIEQKTLLASYSKNILDDEMGLMPLVAEHIAEIRAELKNSKEKIKQLKQQPDLPTIYVEGQLEQLYLRAIFDQRLNDSKGMINIINCEGANKVEKYVHAHMLIRSKTPAWYILDNDEAGRSANQKITAQKNAQGYAGKLSGGILCTRDYPRNDEIIDIKRKIQGYNFDYEFEHMFGKQHFSSLHANMLKCRPMQFEIPPDVSLKDYFLRNKGLEQDEWHLISNQLKPEHKKSFLDQVMCLEYFADWPWNLVEKIAKDFSLKLLPEEDN